MFKITQIQSERHSIFGVCFTQTPYSLYYTLLRLSNSIKENRHCGRDWSLYPRIHSPFLPSSNRTDWLPSTHQQFHQRRAHSSQLWFTSYACLAARRDLVISSSRQNVSRVNGELPGHHILKERLPAVHWFSFPFFSHGHGSGGLP